MINHGIIRMDLLKKPPPGSDKVFKHCCKFFRSKGAKCTDIDLGFNRDRNGQYKLDLGKPIKKWPRKFDLLNNFGTSEHVHDQYHCFGGQDPENTHTSLIQYPHPNHP